MSDVLPTIPPDISDSLAVLEKQRSTAETFGIPLAVLLEITHRCPLQCPYCSNPVELDRGSTELTTEEWKKVLTELAEIGVLQVHFSGGEPTARKDLVELVKHADDVGLYTNLITSAVLLTRDRLYLFRSVPDGHFPADSPSGRLLGHFKHPYRTVPEQSANLRERCESGFERAMFDELAGRGYRLTPQVRSGGYRIDLVVEGARGRRLAIECDGDRFHGADKWADDMARQRVLERAGWTFWRCFASSFTRRREEVMLDLLGTLKELGIEPLGEQPVASAMVEARRVDPMWMTRGEAA